MDVRLEAKDLDPEDRRELETLASRSGTDPRALLRELVHEALRARREGGIPPGDERALARRQRDAMGPLLSELDAIPEVEPDDGICASVDHDKVLYGGPRQKGGSPESGP